MSEPSQADGTSLEPRDPEQPFAVAPAFTEQDPSTADVAGPVSEAAPADAPGELVERSGEIATLPPTDELHAPEVPISSATGQPRRAKVMVVANLLLNAAAVISAVALARSWWLAMHMPSFLASSRLVELWQPRPGGWRSVVAVTLVALIGTVLVSAPAVAAFNAWNGHRWSRIAAVVATVLGGLAYLIGPWAWPAPVLSALGAVLLFLPPVTRYFSHWQRFRDGNPVPLSPQRDVVYGPLPRYL